MNSRIPTEYIAECWAGPGDVWYFNFDAAHLSADDIGHWVEVGPNVKPLHRGILDVIQREGQDTVLTLAGVGGRSDVRLEPRDKVRRVVSPGETRGGVLRYEPSAELEEDDAQDPDAV